MGPAVREEKKIIRDSESPCASTTTTHIRLISWSKPEIVKGGPQTFVYDAFLLFPNQKRYRAHVEEFQHAQHESPVYDRREN